MSDDKTQIRLTATFRGTRGDTDIEQALMILGDPRRPYILINFETDRSRPNEVHVDLDTTGFSPEKVIAFLEELASKMKTEKAMELRPDGTVRPAEYQQAKNG